MVAVTRCLRCLHEWQPRVEKPCRCPACKSPYWDRPRSRVYGLSPVAGNPGTVNRVPSFMGRVPIHPGHEFPEAGDRQLVPIED